MSYTKGPWFCVNNEIDDTFEITNKHRNYYHYVPIAEIQYGFDGDVENEQYSNIKIIVAAPDMLEELERIEKRLGDRFNVDYNDCMRVEIR